MHFRELENIYDNRFSQSNSLFMQRVMGHYLNGTSLASIEMHFEIMKEILYTLKTGQLNQYASALLGQKDGVVISCYMPQVNGIEELSVERVQDSFVHSLSKSEYTGKEKALVAWPKFVADDAQGAIVNHSTDPMSGAQVFNLSNGVKVIYRQTQDNGDTISFRAVSKGGLSVVRENFGKEMAFYASDIANLSAVGGLQRSVWEKLFAYNNLSLKATVNSHLEMLEGYCTPASLEKLFHIVNLNFTQRKDDYSSFDIYRKGKGYEALYRTISPKNVFEDSVRYYNSSNKRLIPVHSKEYVDSIDYQKVQKAINGRFGNAADFVFIIAGKADPVVLKEYIVKYLGSLPASYDKEDWFVTPDYPTKGKVEKRFLHQMVIPRSYVDVTLSCGMQNNQENRVLAQMLQEYLSGIYASGKMKELSPNSTVSAGIEYYPEEILMCRQRFETDSAGSVEILDHMHSKLQEVTYNGIGNEEFEKLKRGMFKRVEMAQEGNRYWLDAFTDSYLFGHNFHTGYLQAIENLTPDRFKAFVDKVYRRGNMITVIMEGTTEDVNTQNLFRENQFIKDFFDL
jgi:zinc protease